MKMHAIALVVLGLFLLPLALGSPHPGLRAGVRPSARSALRVTTGLEPIPMTDPATQSVCFIATPSPALQMFVDCLPVLSAIDVSDGKQHVLKAFRITQELHRDLPPTPLYAFGECIENASMPGPVLIAKQNTPSYIRWENHISDDKHFLAVDPTVARAFPPRGGIPTVTHLHGMETSSLYDGHPQAWYTQYGDTGPTYSTQDYIYYNTLFPAMMWYHDHAVGITRLNNVAGLVGPYIVFGESQDEPAALPKFERDVILFLQDRTFYANGSINYPNVGDDQIAHPSWCPGYFGDTILVNGKVWPYMDVFSFRYRFRILNAASDRFYSLWFDNPNVRFIKIGTDGGFLEAPVTLTNITLAPAERLDCIVDFGGLPDGTTVVLKNSAPTPYPGGPGFPPFDPNSGVASVMQFRVKAYQWEDTSVVPAAFKPILPLLKQPDQTRVRKFTLSEVINMVGNETEVLLANRTYDDPPTEFAPLGATEIWEFINLTPGVSHPIHIHLMKFQIISVQYLNITRFNAGACSIMVDFENPDSCFLNASRGPDPQEIGWKDIVQGVAEAVTRIVVKYTSQDGSPFRFDPVSGPGYLWHCHLLSHEDNSMMRPLHMVSGDGPKAMDSTMQGFSSAATPNAAKLQG